LLLSWHCCHRVVVVFMLLLSLTWCSRCGIVIVASLLWGSRCGGCSTACCRVLLFRACCRAVLRRCSSLAGALLVVVFVVFSAIVVSCLWSRLHSGWPWMGVGCRVEPTWLGSVSTRKGDKCGCVCILAGFPLAHWPCTWSGWEVRKRGEGRWLTRCSHGLAFIVGACPGIPQGGEPHKVGIAHQGTHLGPLLLVAVPHCCCRIHFRCVGAMLVTWRWSSTPLSGRGPRSPSAGH
jgi:hypothetical protein